MQQGQYSEDGRWWWDGAQWVPAQGQQQPQQRQAQPEQAQPRRVVREYKNRKHYERDAKDMMAKGYSPTSEVGGGSRLTATRLMLAGPLALAWRKGHKITVIWELSA